MIRQNQQLGQKQTLNLSPQQIQLLNFIQLGTLELEQRIQDEMLENPALEADSADAELAKETADATIDESSDTPTEDDFDRFEIIDQYQQDNDDTPDYKTAGETRAADESVYSPLLVQTHDFREHLKTQLTVLQLPARELMLAGYIVDSLDDDGYLRTDIPDLADNLSFAHSIYVEEQEIETALDTVQTLEPVGVGARDLRECLLLQIGTLPRRQKGVNLAWRIIDEHLNDFANRNYDKIMRILEANATEVRAAADLIEKLNPRPVAGQTTELVKNQNIIPEFIIEKDEDDGFRIHLTNSNSSSLRLSSDMASMLEAMQRDKRTRQDKSAVQYLRSKVDSALWFMEMVRQREHSMLSTIQALVQLQREYFLTGDPKKIRPMILKDVAEHIGLDISTISRVTSLKYAMTHFGIVHLKDLFNQGMAKTDGEMVTNKEISDLINNLIAAENKQNPITDQKICDILREKGYTVARRTVAKYRDGMNIPVAKMRRGLQTQ